MSSPDPTEGLIRELLAQGHSPVDIAAHLVDRDVANGEYEGCSSELEMAHDEYRRQAESLSEPVFACTATAINAYWASRKTYQFPSSPSATLAVSTTPTARVRGAADPRGELAHGAPPCHRVRLHRPPDPPAGS